MNEYSPVSPNAAVPFEDLFRGTPRLVRGFLDSALRLRDLRQLYFDARDSGDRPISQAVLSQLGVSVQVSEDDIARVPAKGPVVIVANHPFGLLDGLILDVLLSGVRPDFKIVTNAFLRDLEEFRDHTIPVDVFSGRSATRRNARSLRQAIEWLRAGHALAVFPAGEVSHWMHQPLRSADAEWNTLPARCALLACCPVVPVYFRGENSIAFQLAGLVHPVLRTMRLPGELLNKAGGEIEIRIGSPIHARDLAERGTPEEQASYLRARTYTLGHRRTFAARKNPVLPVLIARRSEPIAGEMAGAREEAARLALHNCLLESGRYAVYTERGDRIPALLREIGRLREIAFRAVGEGTGRALDLDRFDAHYQHLILWNKEDARIAGSYRLAWTEDALWRGGPGELYTSTLFRYSPEFFSRLGPAVELGRSFVSPDYQRDSVPLFLLWQGIGRSVARRPSAPILFSAVSISAASCEGVREMIVEHLRLHKFQSELAPFVKPRRPFRSRLMRNAELQLVAGAFQDIEDLNGPIRDLDKASRIPVLLRQYLKLGGRVASFSVDRKFSNALDALLIVDLRETPPKHLAKYLGRSAPPEWSK